MEMVGPIREDTVCACHGFHVKRRIFVARRHNAIVAPDQHLEQQDTSSSHRRHRALCSVQYGLYVARAFSSYDGSVLQRFWESPAAVANCRGKASVSGVVRLLRNVDQWMPSCGVPTLTMVVPGQCT